MKSKRFHDMRAFALACQSQDEPLVSQEERRAILDAMPAQKEPSVEERLAKAERDIKLLAEAMRLMERKFYGESAHDAARGMTE